MLSKFLDPKNDVAFKKIFGSERNKDILIHFINDILGFKDSGEIENVEFLTPILDPEIAAKKESIVDVLCRDKNGVQYIIEMQVANHEGFEKRAQYYASKAYSRQADRGSRYHDLKEVIFIAISNYVVFPHKEAYKSDHVILDKESYEHDLKDFSFTFIELPKFKKDKIEELANIVEKWCYFFKYASLTSEEDVDKIIGSDMVIKRAYEALNQFSWNEKELIMYEQEVKRIWDMQAAFEYATNRGLEEGQAKGRVEGRAEGRAEEKLKIAGNLLESGLSIDLVSQVTGLSLEELNKFK